jgi:nitrate reductase NapAB chaperone NapD
MTEILSLPNVPLLINAAKVLENHFICGAVLYDLSAEELQLFQEVNTLHPETFEFSDEPRGKIVVVNENARILLMLINLKASELETALRKITSPGIKDLF